VAEREYKPKKPPAKMYGNGGKLEFKKFENEMVLAVF
jgi:hypothetical protein